MMWSIFLSSFAFCVSSLVRCLWLIFKLDRFLTRVLVILCIFWIVVLYQICLLSSPQKSWIFGHSIQLFLSPLRNLFFHLLLLNEVESNSQPKSSSLFSLIPRQLGYARSHHHSGTGKSEGKPLTSSLKSCNLRCLDKPFPSPGRSRQPWFLSIHSLLGWVEVSCHLSTQAASSILPQAASLCHPLRSPKVARRQPVLWGAPSEKLRCWTCEPTLSFPWEKLGADTCNSQVFW